MAAAPRAALATFKGRSGQTYTYSVYLSDVAAAFGKWNTVQTAVTGDTDFITAPEDMQLIDLTVATGLTDTTNGTFWLNDAPVGNTITSWAAIVNTLPMRSFPPIKIAGGRKVQIKQNA